MKIETIGRLEDEVEKVADKVIHTKKSEGFPGGGVVKNPPARGFPGGAVVENLPSNAGDMGSSPDLGRSHMPRGN